MKRIPIALAAALSLAACSEEDAPPAVTAPEGVTVTDGFVRPLAAGGMATAAYLDLTSEAGDALVGATAQGFGVVEIHEAFEEDGVSRMRPVAEIQLPEDERVVLQPGGRHLMLMQPDGPLAEGDSVNLVLKLRSGEEVVVTLPVQRPEGS